MNVLFADDQSDTRQIFQLAFKLRGHDSTVAENGAEALKAMAAPSAQRFDVIVMDWHMPLVDGITAIRCIRSLPSGARVPIVFLTAFDDAESAALGAGADLILRKPIFPDDLVDQLERVVQSRAALADDADVTVMPSSASPSVTAPSATAGAAS